MVVKQNVGRINRFIEVANGFVLQTFQVQRKKPFQIGKQDFVRIGLGKLFDRTFQNNCSGSIFLQLFTQFLWRFRFDGKQAFRGNDQITPRFQ
ncbi:hypothetical protein D3C71_807910 [compost metagenome]